MTSQRQFNSSLVTCHSPLYLNYLTDEVVLLRFGYKDVDEIAGLGRAAFGRVVDEDAAVYLGRLRLHAPLPEQVSLFGRALEQHAHDLSDSRAVAAE